MKTCIMALDEGTTSARCALYDRAGHIASLAQKEFTQHYPQEGWVEQDAMEIWTTQMEVARDAMRQAGVTHQNIAAIGITNQRETVVVWDRDTGIPICPAIVWQCRRTAAYCDQLKAAGYEDMIREKTGLLIDAYFSGTKLRWILDHVPDARRRAENGDLLFGTMETWLIWKLTGGRVHVTDYSNASRTMLFNIHTLTWDEDLLRLLDIPACMLPEPVPSSRIYGLTDPDILGGAIPIAGAAGDQQAALFGQTCFEIGDAKNTYGTGGFLLLNTGKEPITSRHGLVTTIAWGLGGEVTYALEGSVFVCGAVIQWLRDELHILDDAARSEEMARAVPDTLGVYVVPAFVGLGAPHWDSYARGAVLGLTRGANRYHLVRAALESMAYQTADLLEAMAEDLGRPLHALRVDGGAAANDFLMEFQADVLDLPVLRPSSIETTSLGAAYLAGLATGYWNNLDDIRENWQLDRTFQPSMEEADRERHLRAWRRAVAATRSFTAPDRM